MIGMTKIIPILALALLLATGCGGQSNEADTRTPDERFREESFDPCLQIPEEFFSKHGLTREEKGQEISLEAWYWIPACAYSGTKIYLDLGASSRALNQIKRENPERYIPTRIANRQAIILLRQVASPLCRLDVEISGGILALRVGLETTEDPCTTLTALAEELVSMLPPGV